MKFNIVYLHCHDAGRYIQPYGHAVQTPWLQKFAEQGVMFRNAFSVAPGCSPSRAALLTGSYPHENGMFGLAHLGHRLHDYSQHAAQYLQTQGYYTVLCGMHHEANPPVAERSDLGYDKDYEAYPDFDQPCDAVDDFLKNRPKDKPFFMSVGYGAPHRAKRDFARDEPLANPHYQKPPPHLPDNPTTRLDMAWYNASVRGTDRSMGRVIEAIDQAGLADQTIIFITTDHGIAFPQMKSTLFDAGTGVMLMMRGPGFEGGQCVDGMVSHLDVLPTLAEACGFDSAPWYQGKPMQPLINDEADQIHDLVLTELNYHVSYEPTRAVRSPRYKYIRRFHDYDHPSLPNIDDSRSKDHWIDKDWRNTTHAEEQLYDLEFDPLERRNLLELAEPGEARAIADDMYAKMQKLMQKTNDPLCEGHIPPPPQGQIAARWDNSPADKRPTSEFADGEY